LVIRWSVTHPKKITVGLRKMSGPRTFV